MPADTTLRVWGLGHLAGATVGAIVAGVDMGTYTVAANGSVDIVYGADASGTVTAAYLAANFATGGAGVVGSDHDVTFSVFDGTTITSVTVPILVGLAYTATGQLLRPMMIEALTNSQRGAALGELRRGHQFAMLVEGVSEVKVGTGTANLTTVPMTSDGRGTPELALDSDEPYTGVLTGPLMDGYTYDTQFMWRVSRPYRFTLSGVSTFIKGE